jgi:hypothetical protein
MNKIMRGEAPADNLFVNCTLSIFITFFHFPTQLGTYPHFPSTFWHVTYRRNRPQTKKTTQNKLTAAAFFQQLFYNSTLACSKKCYQTFSCPDQVSTRNTLTMTTNSLQTKRQAKKAAITPLQIR